MPFRRLLLEASWMLLIPLVESIYLILNHSTENVYILVSVLDKKTPFIPYFIVPYLAWYGLLFITLIWFLTKDIILYRSSIISILYGLLISFIVFSLFQTTVPRPEIMGQDIFSQLIQWIYTIDNPYNAFPSIHVLTSCIIFLGCLQTKKDFPKTSIALQTTIILVILSTVFLKQHTLVDVLGGLILGGCLFKAVNSLEGTLLKKREDTSKDFTKKQSENGPLWDLE